MKPHDPSDVLFVCPLPPALLDEIDAFASKAGCDRTTLVRELLGEALRIRALASAIDDQAAMDQAAMDATIIPFPRPSWAVDLDLDLDGEGG
ncbi:MAG TPA: hypothetical protein VH877_24270 [Polyangia bacterium]|jgi:hypothetical protein|nr:hypothetical protein [Polyangia bacterium]